MITAERIIAGELSASSAIGKPELYPELSRNKFLGTSHKIEAGEGFDVLTAVLYMQPANESGREACAGRSAGCTDACLAESVGRMSMTSAQRARRRRHAAFFSNRNAFLADLHAEIQSHTARAAKQGKVAAIRLNGTTDLPWHRMRFIDHGGRLWGSLHEANPDVQFYEYTKMPLSIAGKNLPPNLHLTFSLSDREDSDARAIQYLSAGLSVAMVADHTRHNPPGSVLLGGHVWPTVDGDAHDARFLDPASSVVMLAAKGRAKRDTTGFVRKVA